MPLTLALQERIEQEMNENPLLEQQEVDPVAEEAAEDEPTPARTLGVKTKKSWWSTTTSDNQRRLSSDLQNMISELPSTFDDSFRRSANRMAEEADRRHDLMANAQSRPESLNDFFAASIGRDGHR